VLENVVLGSEPARAGALDFDGARARIDVGELRCLQPEDECTLRPADTGSPDGKAGFVMMAGAGFDASIMESAHELKPTFGWSSYVVAALQNLTPLFSHFTLTLDGETIETEGIAVLIVNFGRLQFDLALTSASDAQDGLFEVVVLHTKNAAELLPTVWAAFLDRLGDHPWRPPSLEIHSAREILVKADPPLHVQYDGEVVAAPTPIAARVLPGAATFVVPEDSAFLKLD